MLYLLEARNVYRYSKLPKRKATIINCESCKGRFHPHFYEDSQSVPLPPPSPCHLAPGSLNSSSFIILITVQANIICGVSHFPSYADFYLIAGSSQSHFNDAQTAELLKQTQRQPSVKELESAEETGLEHCPPPPSASVQRGCGCCSGRTG